MQNESTVALRQIINSPAATPDQVALAVSALAISEALQAIARALDAAQ